MGLFTKVYDKTLSANYVDFLNSLKWHFDSHDKDKACVLVLDNNSSHLIREYKSGYN